MTVPRYRGAKNRDRIMVKKNLLKDSSGASAIEYGLIVALIGVGILSAASDTGEAVNSTMTTIEECLDGVSTACTNASDSSGGSSSSSSSSSSGGSTGGSTSSSGGSSSSSSSSGGGNNGSSGGNNASSGGNNGSSGGRGGGRGRGRGN